MIIEDLICLGFPNNKSTKRNTNQGSQSLSDTSGNLSNTCACKTNLKYLIVIWLIHDNDKSSSLVCR
jgi:hypothetical protein